MTVQTPRFRYSIENQQESSTLTKAAVVAASSIAASQCLAKEDAQASAFAQTELPQVFSINCRWSNTTKSVSVIDSDEIPRVSLSSSHKPAVLDGGKVDGLVELTGVGETRHFIMPAKGGFLAGEMLTVFPDGRALRSQAYNIFGELSASSNIGHCEVIE